MDVSDEARLDGVIDDLESSPDWRTGAPANALQLLGRLPGSSATEVQRARLTLLSTHEAVRARDAADAALTILGVRDLAVRRGHRALEAGAEQALSGLFREIGDPSASMERAVAALALDGDDLDPVLRCRLSLTMADARARTGSTERSREHYREALDRSRAVAGPWLSLQVLNNWTYTELVAGELGTAGDLADRMQALGEQDGATFLLGYVDTVVEVLHARGRSTEAVAMLRERLSTDPADAVVDAADCWLVLAQMERETGDLHAAGLSLDVADRLTARDELQELAVQALGERARLLAAHGDHAGAYALHRRFHGETLELRSRASEVRAQTLHAIFEVDEARRESARYRTLSYLDPLTGLHNRRHVDEDLDRRLGRRTGTTPPLAVAMLDLDHFKLVNDTCSHEAGDAVLVRLATLLEAATTSTGGYAARLGGEEFLLVLPDHDLPAAHAVAEALRQAIATHDWTGLCPGVPVTASMGLAVAPDTGQRSLDRTGLLRRADQGVYAAKSRGRDRVDPPIAALEAQARAAP